MALLIYCYKCGQNHLSGSSCRPEALENFKEQKRCNEIMDLQRQINKLREKIKELEH